MTTASETIHIRQSGLRFTQIIIKRIVKNKKYIAEFNYGFGDKKMFACTVAGNSEQECIAKTEKFLETTLLDTEITK